MESRITDLMHQLRDLWEEELWSHYSQDIRLNAEIHVYARDVDTPVDSIKVVGMLVLRDNSDLLEFVYFVRDTSQRSCYFQLRQPHLPKSTEDMKAKQDNTIFYNREGYIGNEEALKCLERALEKLSPRFVLSEEDQIYYYGPHRIEECVLEMREKLVRDMGWSLTEDEYRDPRLWTFFEVGDHGKLAIPHTAMQDSLWYQNGEVKLELATDSIAFSDCEKTLEDIRRLRDAAQLFSRTYNAL